MKHKSCSAGMKSQKMPSGIMNQLVNSAIAAQAKMSPRVVCDDLHLGEYQKARRYGDASWLGLLRFFRKSFLHVFEGSF